jgi:hypothetical protein
MRRSLRHHVRVGAENRVAGLDLRRRDARLVVRLRQAECVPHCQCV